jgi:hypothetical protein
MICSSSAFVPLFQVLGHRLKIRSQFGKGLLYVKGRWTPLRVATILPLAEDSFDVSMMHQTLVSAIRQAVESFPMQPNCFGQAERTMAGVGEI